MWIQARWSSRSQRVDRMWQMAQTIGCQPACCYLAARVVLDGSGPEKRRFFFFFLLVNLLIGWFYACMCAAVRLSVPRLMFNQAKDLIFLTWNVGSCPSISQHRWGTPLKSWSETLIHVSDSCGPCWPLHSLISLSHTSYSGEGIHPNIFMQRWIY